uniref:Uncharacterized protein n=1 Tax=Rhizophora mucronata TaxID=61149 RepID=A0A2P2NW69_RHIMU
MTDTAPVLPNYDKWNCLRCKASVHQLKSIY